MGLFRRKKQKEEGVPTIEIKTPCEMFGHLWQDFPWIIEQEYDGNRSHIRISEIYVCHICGERKKVVLFNEFEKLSRKAHDEKVNTLKTQFKAYIKPMPIVYDMINDMELLDKERLAAWNQLHNSSAEKPPFQLRVGKEIFDTK